MFFEDGPYTFKPNLETGDLFASPKGLSSVTTVEDSLDASTVATDIKNYHSQTKDVLSMIYSSLPGFDADVVNGDHELPDLKSNAESVRFRNEGNREYSALSSNFDYFELEEVLFLYTKSVAHAVEGSTEQMLALGNRSAVLLRLRRYIPCLLDVNRVLKMDCPEELRKKILERKKRCLSHINDTSIDTEATDPVKGAFDREEDAEWANLCKFDNPLIPNASSKIKIEFNKKWGRHLIATENIEAGEILSCQKFNVLALRPDEKEDHCSYCLVKCYALIPCKTCPKALYCSSDCRTNAYNSYHRVECRLNLDHPNNLKLMAVRSFLIGTEQGAQLRNLMRRLPKQDLFRPNVDPSNKPFINDYLAALNLSRTYNPEVGNFFIIFVGSMINSLNDIGFFGNDLPRSRPRTEEGRLSDVEVYAGMLVMNHAISFKSHTFAISPVHELQCQCENVVGTGVSVLHSFINHSCHPNVRFCTRNREHVLMSIRPIKKGEQLFHSYYQPFEAVPSRAQRRKTLSMFFGFKCECEACAKNWTIENVMSGARFLGRNKKTAKRNLTELLLPITTKHYEIRSRAEILQILKRVVEWFHVHFMKPTADMLSCETLLFQYIAFSYDDISHSEALITTSELKQCIKIFLIDLEKKIGYLLGR